MYGIINKWLCAGEEIQDVRMQSSSILCVYSILTGFYLTEIVDGQFVSTL